MKPLGLHAQLGQLKSRCAAHQAAATAPDISPADAYQSSVTAHALRREITRMSHAILESHAVLTAVEQQLAVLTKSEYQSRDRAIAITALEQTEDRLRRELGDLPGA